MKKLLLYICLLAVCGVAEAAKITVAWVNPTTNTDGSPLTDLWWINIEWGTCNGTAFGVRQSNLIVMENVVQVTKAFVYPTGLTKVCVRAFAVNSQGTASASSNVAIKDLLPSPGKPVTLGQPVIISFNQEKDNG
jgi:hypothetical protein